MLKETEFDFGFGGADQARLFDADGVTLLDAYTWESHAATTYGRCPDGGGEFQETTTPTLALTARMFGPCQFLAMLKAPFSRAAMRSPIPVTRLSPQTFNHVLRVLNRHRSWRLMLNLTTQSGQPLTLTSH